MDKMTFGNNLNGHIQHHSHLSQCAYPLHHGGVCGQSGGQCSGAVLAVIKPADLLPQDSLEAHLPQPTSQQLSRLGKGVTLSNRSLHHT